MKAFQDKQCVYSQYIETPASNNKLLPQSYQHTDIHFLPPYQRMIAPVTNLYHNCVLNSCTMFRVSMKENYS